MYPRGVRDSGRRNRTRLERVCRYESAIPEEFRLSSRIEHRRGVVVWVVHCRHYGFIRGTLESAPNRVNRCKIVCESQVDPYTKSDSKCFSSSRTLLTIGFYNSFFYDAIRKRPISFSRLIKHIFWDHFWLFRLCQNIFFCSLIFINSTGVFS